MGGAGMSTDEHPEAHPDYVARSRQAAVDRRLREREELDELITEMRYTARSSREIADAILAAGWRKQGDDD
jgi:hypothetical protein